MLENIPYKNPLIVGTGGGNDIVSSVVVLSDFVFSGRNADIAGVCSPAAVHFYGGNEEAPVNIVSSSAKRFINSRLPKEIPFIDAKLPELLQAQGWVAKVYNLSCRYGTAALVDGLNKLISANKYDSVIAVDVGGDILARGKKDPTILSPLMDFTALYVVSQLSVPSTLVEFGLQTDGELRPQGCAEILAELSNNGILQGTFRLPEGDSALCIFKRIYSEIERIRHGHTAHMFFQTLAAKDDIHTEYKFRLQAGDKKWHYAFPLVLESKYFGKGFVFDLKKLADSRALAFPYESSLEQYIKTKQIVDCKTELDLHYVWCDDVCLWLGLLCPQIDGSMRSEILSAGLERRDLYDCALLWAKDAAFVPKDAVKRNIADFVVVGKEAVQVDTVSHKIEQIM